MRIGIIYFLVIVFSNTIGAIAGLSGGVIIRPIFDAVGYHDVISISFYSGVAVLTMSTVSTATKLKKGISIQSDLALLISLGSVIGGILGNLLLGSLLNHFPSDETVLGIQIIVAIVALTFALSYTIKQWKSFEITNKFAFLVIGGMLGCIASLLGIGGGPINVAAFMLLFKMSIKEAATYSIVTIFFAQLSRLITVGLTTGFQIFDLSVLAFIVPAATIGGFLGSRLGHIFPEKIVIKVYQTIVVSVIILNAINGIQLL